jgi:branched-chain amino acid transport system permease protein
MSQLVQQLFNGLMLGCLYALIAVGYTMVYGIIELINFAFGELFMLGAFACIMLTSDSLSIFGRDVTMPGISFFVALPIAMVVVGALGVLIERLAYRPLRAAPRLAALISAIGVSILLQNVAQSIFGSQQVNFPDIPAFTSAEGLSRSVHILGADVTYVQLFVVVTTVVVMVLLNLFVTRTRIGRAMRASAQDKNTSALMGVNVNRVIAITFLIGSAVGALAGGLYGAVYHFARPDMGFFPGLKAFIAAVLGGIGNIPGAFLGGIVLGMVESLGSAYLPMGSQYRDAFAFVILILLLSFKPNGLLGSPVSQKA